MQAEVQTPCVIAGPASDVSSMTTPPSVADDMTTEIESPARAVNPYTRGKLVGLCGAEQSRVVRESRSRTSGAIGTTRHGSTKDRNGTSRARGSPATRSGSQKGPNCRPSGVETTGVASLIPAASEVGAACDDEDCGCCATTRGGTSGDGLS